MKKVLAALVIAALLWAGCGKSGSGPKTAPDSAGGDSGASADLGKQSLEGANPPPVVDEVITDGGTYTLRFNAEPDTLNPLTGRDAYGAAVRGFINSGLVTRDPDTLDWEPRLAESWDVSEDHLSYTFHLRRDVKWHDGAPFTSADVIYSYEKMIDPKVDAPQAKVYYRDLKSVTAPDPYTVVFTWAKPYFLSFEFSAGFSIFPKHIFDTGDEFNSHPAGRNPVGTGMYRFVEWKTGEEIILERNDDYFGPMPHIKKIVIRFIPDDNAALLQASSGVVDGFLLGVSEEQWVKELNKPVFKDNFNRYYYYDPNYRFVGWNHRRPFFSDKLVRRAMTHLIDRQAILNQIMYGLGKTVTGTFYVNGKDYSNDIEPFAYDPAEARRLLDESGWIDHDGDGIRDKTIDGKVVKFEFSFMFGSRRALSEKVGVLLQEELKKLGVVMNIQQLEWAIFTEKLNEGDFDAVTLGWSLGIEQDPYQLWHSTSADRGSNFIAFNNAEADDLIERARVEFDPVKRRELYHRFNEIIHEEQPYTFLFCQAQLDILPKRFHNVVVHKLGLDMRDWYVPAALQK